MLETPHITQLAGQHTAVIRLKVARDELSRVVGPAVAEVRQALAAQGIALSGPLVMRHLGMSPGQFDIELGFPVEKPIAQAGRVEPASLPATRAVRATYQGPYEQLFAGWDELGQWIRSDATLTPTPHLWESYTTGPESGLEPSKWRTELIQPLQS